MNLVDWLPITSFIYKKLKTDHSSYLQFPHEEALTTNLIIVNLYFIVLAYMVEESNERRLAFCKYCATLLKFIFYLFRQDNSSTQSARSAEEKSLRAILFTMSLLFIICQAWKIIPDVYELFFCRENGHHCKMDGPVSNYVTLPIYC